MSYIFLIFFKFDTKIPYSKSLDKFIDQKSPIIFTPAFGWEGPLKLWILEPKLYL